ncbi:MAG: RNA polymerase sigma factor [Pseudomonadota bacterium]
MDNSALALNEFLRDVEQSAYRMALLAVSHREDALDLVQDSMMTLARKYAERPTEEWRPLFFRILQNRIRDCYRRRKSRGKVFSLFGGRTHEDDPTPSLEEIAEAPRADNPEVRSELDTSRHAIETALQSLPIRQREAFLLRSWQGLSVAETAVVMECSEGSVKTHLSRAIKRLRELLGDELT